MPEDRLLRILRRLSGDEDSVPTTKLCVMAADVTTMSGAGIMLMTGDLPQGSMCTTDTVSTLIEELQYTLGEGPCVDAHVEHRPILEPDLSAPAVTRWPAFTPPAVDAGVRAVFGFPLEIGSVHLGALNLYRDRPGPLTGDQHADALVVASVAARAVIGMQAAASPGSLGPDLEIGTNFRFGVHQASGMVAVQLGVSITEALIRLRAHAFRHDRLVGDVAGDVVARGLRFDDLDGDGETPQADGRG